MRRLASVAIALVGGALSVTALTWCASFSADGQNAPKSEAGADVGADADVAGDPDAAAPDGRATGDSGCRLIVGDPVTGSQWEVLGTAAASGGFVELTDFVKYEAGGIVHIVDTPLDSFRATIRVRVEKSARPADGMSFFWSPSADAGLGENGSNLGFCGDGGPGGSAVTIRTKPSDDDSGTDSVALRDPSRMDCSETNARTIPPLADGNPVTFVIDVDAATTTVRVRQGTTELFSAQLPSTFPIRSFGLTAATGGDYTRHTVESVVVEVCH